MATCAGLNRNCVSSHKREPPRPVRLLDVGPTIGLRNLRLVEFENRAEVGEYVALSYCWCSQSRLKLSTATLEKLKY
jgi:hypothetical protein